MSSIKYKYKIQSFKAGTLFEIIFDLFSLSLGKTFLPQCYIRYSVNADKAKNYSKQPKPSHPSFLLPAHSPSYTFKYMFSPMIFGNN